MESNPLCPAKHPQGIYRWSDSMKEPACGRCGWPLAKYRKNGWGNPKLETHYYITPQQLSEYEASFAWEIAL